MDIKNTLQGGLMMLFVMWVNEFRFEAREIGGFFILFALFIVRDRKRDQEWK